MRPKSPNGSSHPDPSQDPEENECSKFSTADLEDHILSLTANDDQKCNPEMVAKGECSFDLKHESSSLPVDQGVRDETISPKMTRLVASVSLSKAPAARLEHKQSGAFAIPGPDCQTRDGDIETSKEDSEMTKETSLPSEIPKQCSDTMRTQLVSSSFSSESEIYPVQAKKVSELQVATANKLEWWTPRKISLLVLLAAAVLTGTTSIIVVQVKKSRKMIDAMPTSAPTLPAEERYDRIAAILTKEYEEDIDMNGRIDFFEAGHDSPQKQAFQWIAMDDEYHVSVDDIPHLVQRYALAVLFYSLGGNTTWENKFEFLSTDHECSWSGALLCNSMEQITGIDLRENNLVGRLPRELSKLTALESMIFDSNDLTGALPAAFQNLVGLTRLDLWENDLTGSLPSGYQQMSKLVSLRLGRNSLTGTIPEEIQHLTALEVLSLERNLLSGAIPDGLWALTEMRRLELDRQSLTGTISPEIGGWRNLTRFHVNKNNGFTGTIPTEIGLLTRMTSLKTSQNHMRGTIPSELGNLVHLSMLALSRNGYSGSIPKELGNLTQLKEFYIQNTWVTGNLEFLCDAIGTGDLENLEILNADLTEVECSCCVCCLY